MKWLLALFLLTAPAWGFPVERCVNLDNALNSPRAEGEWGYRIERGHLGRIAAAGFDTVRLPVEFSTRWDGQRIDPRFLGRVDDVIRQALGEGMGVILALHGFDALRRDPGARAGTFVALWSALAAHYEGWPPGLVFELYNEPAERMTARRTQALYDRVIPILRARHPSRWIVVSGPGWADIRGMKRIRRRDTRIVRSFHYYQPWDFTHQGAAWLDAPPPETRWGSGRDRARIRRDITRAARTPGPVFLGEFGVNEKVDPRLRWDWTREVRRAAEANGVGWCHWGFASTFPLYDRGRAAWLAGARAALFD